MSAQKQSAPVVATTLLDPYAHYDREYEYKLNAPVSICRVLARSDYLKANSRGDRVSLDPQKAQWLERQNVVVVLAANIKPADIRAAGGIDAYIALNPKVKKVKDHDLQKLGPIPGIPTAEQRKKPWEFEVVE